LHIEVLFYHVAVERHIKPTMSIVNATSTGAV